MDSETAIYKGDASQIKRLLDEGADVNASGGHFGNALQAAAIEGNREIVSLLLDHKANVNASGGHYGNALQAAASASVENREIVSLLLDHKANVNASGGYFGNALQAAAFRENREIVSLLLDHKANVNASGGHYGNALQAAAIEGHQEIVSLLHSHGADITIQPLISNRSSILHAAVASDNYNLVKMILDLGGEVHLQTQDDSGRTPLHVAIGKPNVESARLLLQKGASPDTLDFGDKSSFQLAIQAQHIELIFLLFSKSTLEPSTVSATQWRRALCAGQLHHLEMIGGEAATILVNTDIASEMKKLSFPLSGDTRFKAEDDDFMSREKYEKRIFVLADGSILGNLPEFGFRRCWWRKQIDGYKKYWVVQSGFAPSINTIQRTTSNTFFVECSLSLYCVRLPEDLKEGSQERSKEWSHEWSQESAAFLRKYEKRQAILWIMIKSDAHNVQGNSDGPFLRSKFFFSTSDYAHVPNSATDLFLPLINEIHQIWNHNFEAIRTRLSWTRIEVLKSAGNDQQLIQTLLNDAQILDQLSDIHRMQIQTLESFERQYFNESKLLHELSSKMMTDILKFVKEAIKNLKEECGSQLDSFVKRSQSIIELEFNLTSIAEAQKSTLTSRSVKRLTWITFVFLPLLFIASLFGMNVDILKNNPPWWWYFPLAAGVTLVTFAVWLVFKRYHALEGNLEKRFAWLFRSKKVTDVEKAHTNTREFPASGKKRS